MKLTEKQKRFCDYYITTGNATESAVKAGYSKNTSKVIACENLTKPYIKAYIDKKIKKKDKKRIASQDEVLEYYTKVLRGEEKDISIDMFGKEHENRPTLKERTKAADALAKRYGLDKLVIESKEEVTIIDDIN